jgi:hypothetical protein
LNHIPRQITSRDIAGRKVECSQQKAPVGDSRDFSCVTKLRMERLQP